MPSKKSGASKGEGPTVMRACRLPKDLDRALVSDSRQDSLTVTDLVISVLTKYEKFDKFDQKFGFISFGRATFRALMDALPEEKITEVALANALDVEEFIDFRYKKRDLSSLLSTVEILSKYPRRFDYELLQDASGVTIVMRTNLGEKFALFLSETWKTVITKTLGVAPTLELKKNQVTFRVTSRPLS